MKFKLYIVIAVSLAFIFRLLFVNVGLMTSAKASSSGKRSTAHFSSHLKKRKRNAETVVQPSGLDVYAAVELCEEDSDNEDDLVKTHSPALLSFLCLLFKNTDKAPASDHAFATGPSHLYPKKYLTLSILRI